MPMEIDYTEFEHELDKVFSSEQRDWLARLMHDHVSGLIGNITIQVEIIDRMMKRDMDIAKELASLKENVWAASKHVAAIEQSIRGAD